MKPLWENNQKVSFLKKINFKTKFTDFIIIFGYPSHVQNNIPVNNILLSPRHIFSNHPNQAAD